MARRSSHKELQTLVAEIVHAKPISKRRTIFEFLLETLHTLPFAEREITNGEIEATGLPLREMFADGLFLVLLRSAELGKISLHSHREVARVALRVDRLLTAGIALTYASPAAAAQAFSDAVTSEVTARVATLSKNTLHAARSCWQDASARFIATLIKTARLFGEHLATLRTQLHKNNATGPCSLDYLRLDTDEDDSQLIIQSLDLREDVLFDAPTITTLRATEQYLLGRNAKIKALKTLPLRCGDLPNDIAIASSGWSIKTTWINTQLLLAAGNLPDAEHLEEDEYAVTMDVLMQAKTEDIVTAFLKRMRARKWKPDTQSEACIKTIAEKGIKHLRSLKNKRIDEYVTAECFIHLFSGNVALSPEVALHIVTTGGSVTGEIDTDAVSTKALIAQIDWNTVTARDISAIMQQRRLSPLDLMTGILKMPRQRRASAVTALVTSDHVNGPFLDRATMTRLVEERLVVPSEELFRDHPHIIPVAFAKREMKRLVRAPRGILPLAQVEPHYIVSLAIALGNETEDILLTRGARYEAVMRIDSEIIDRVHQEHSCVTREEEACFRKLFSEEAWNLIVLSGHLISLAASYKDTHRHDEEKISPWGSPSSSRYEEDILKEKLGKTPSPSLYKTFTETRVFHWLYAGTPHLAKQWHAYTKTRDAYYATYASRTKQRKIKRHS